MLENKLKELSTEEIQLAIAKAIQELNGVEYTVRIKSIEYDSNPLFGGGEISLNVCKASIHKGEDIVSKG